MMQIFGQWRNRVNGRGYTALGRGKICADFSWRDAIFFKANESIGLENAGDLFAQELSDEQWLSKFERVGE